MAIEMTPAPSSPGTPSAAAPPCVSAPGIIIAAPSSGSGKTTITLALLRALRARGIRVGSMKIGPDFIDPMFHLAASGRTCFNLDDWAMADHTFDHTVACAARDAELVIAEGVMGLFDGSGSGRGSTADVAARLGWPVVLVLDVAGMSASAAALARGFIDHRDDVNVCGVVLNRLGSAKHRSLVEDALQASAVPLLGALARDAQLVLPSRHLGLVQADEHPQLEAFMQRAAVWVTDGIDLDALLAQSQPQVQATAAAVTAPAPIRAPLPVLGQRIAVARDAAFGFSYPLTIDGWRAQGAQIEFFSPLADEAPAADADSVYLPGGYPELHAGHLSGCRRFIEGVRAAAKRAATIYGECGGFMVLGNELRDRDGTVHPMCGLLPVSTSFASPRMTLGYRDVRLLAGPGHGAQALGKNNQRYRGHEFHFARIIDGHGNETSRDDVQALFAARNAGGDNLGTVGLSKGSVFGSFIHLIDRID